jgi:AraC-like DNA-binding protein
MRLTRRKDEATTREGTTALSHDLRRVLRTELLKDACSASEVARLFSMHRRTLNRHLSTEGLAFRRVVDEIRFEIACELLVNTEMALGQVAAVLRYSELSAFTRAFRRWSGETPSAWRSSHRGDAVARRSRARRLRFPQPDPHRAAAGWGLLRAREAPDGDSDLS